MEKGLRVIQQAFKDEMCLFNLGLSYDSYLKMGSHSEVVAGKKGFRFTVWAPHAIEVAVVGDFNNWNKGQVMELISDTGIWTTFCSEATAGQCYKYRITQADGTIKLKIDPYGFEFEIRPKDATIIKSLPVKNWKDGLWQANKKRFDLTKRPINIYEVHLSSWKCHSDGSWYSIPELQQELIPYVKEMGYTHIEFMPLMEHPLDASWGYQLTGYYALASKYGTMEAFQDFVEAAHEANLGVLMDWVPGHFNRNDYALAYFDGTPQFEYTDRNQANNIRWGTINFDLGKPQVQSFLISNAMFWIELFHLDGIRVDSVSNMLYLDYDEGEWIPNDDGTNHNYKGIAFLQKLNKAISNRYPQNLMIAEESSNFRGVTASIEEGGLGFNYKWNMGWMNDTLRFFEMDPLYRKNHFNLITFSFVYMFNEKYILPFSHDEVVHGKKSLMHKMSGDRYNQFAGLRTMEAFMMTHPGKKLNFMGSEFGQFLEWRFDEGLEWSALKDDMNIHHFEFTKKLQAIYKQEHALWELDHTTDGVDVIDADNTDETVLTFIRKGKQERDFLIVVFNFVPVQRQYYKVGVPYQGTYEELLNTELAVYGGSWTKKQGPFKTTKEKVMRQPYAVEVTLPALSCIILRPKRIFRITK